MEENREFVMFFNRCRGERVRYPLLEKHFTSADEAVRFIKRYRLRIARCNGDHQMSIAISSKLQSWLGGRKPLLDYLFLGIIPEDK